VQFAGEAEGRRRVAARHHAEGGVGVAAAWYHTPIRRQVLAHAAHCVVDFPRARAGVGYAGEAVQAVDVGAEG
jgi:hypothetical protein